MNIIYRINEAASTIRRLYATGLNKIRVSMGIRFGNDVRETCTGTNGSFKTIKGFK